MLWFKVYEVPQTSPWHMIYLIYLTSQIYWKSVEFVRIHWKLLEIFSLHEYRSEKSLEPWPLKKKTEIWICQKLSENVKNCKEMVKNDLYSLHLIRALIKYILLYLCNDIYLCHPPFSKYLKKILIYSLICENGSVFKLQVVLEAENKWKLIVAEL